VSTGVRKLLGERIGLLRLVLLSSPRIRTALAFLALLTALLPAMTAVAVGIAVSRVDDVVARSDAGVAVPALVAIGVLLLVDHVAQSLLTPVRQLAASQINGAIRRRVRRAVSVQASVDHLDDQVVRDAAALPIDNAFLFSIGAGAEGQLWLVARFVGCGLAAVVVAVASPVGGAVLLTAMVWQRALLRRHYAKAVASAAVDTVADGRAAAYWAEVAAAAPAAKEVRVFGLARWSVERYRHHAIVPVQALERIVRRTMTLHGKVFALNLAGALVAFGLVAHAGASGSIDPGLLAAGLGGVVGVARGLGVMGWEAYSIEAAVPLLDAVRALERFGDDEDAGMTVRRRRPARPLLEGPPSIRFEGVAFRYPQTTTDVLSDLNLEVHPGDSLAIVGENGVGKTTVLRLLGGFHVPTSGRILVNGEDLRDLDPVWWRRHLALVFQSFSRLELSALDNVALADIGRHDGLARAQAAAAAAETLELVEALPDGWDTPLSRARTGGVELSGGQWQRIALARALYATSSGASVLALDEPTASLDVAAESAVFDKLMEAATERTTIVVSHRFSTVRRADRIVVIADGGVVEDGAHGELLAAGGTYARLYRLQADRFGDGVEDDRVDDHEVEEGVAAG